MALGTDYIIRYLSDISGAVQGAKELETVNSNVAKNIQAQYGEVTRVLRDLQPTTKTSTIQINGKDAIKTLETTGIVAETTSGKFLQLTNTATRINGVLQSNTASFKGLSKEAANGNDVFANFTNSIGQLASRAILTIPIWLFLRGVIMGAISAIGNSFKDLGAESLSLNKISNTMSGTTSDVAANMAILKKETEDLALSTGVSHDKILATFQKFSAVGMEFTTAMNATTAVTKLAVITQSDATTSADAFAHALSVLIDKNASVSQQQQQTNQIVALTAELWKTNGFNIEEFTGSLEKFAITSKSVNFTTNQTLALLATLSKSGLGSAGALLRNSIGQLLVNLDKLSGTLGVKVNPQLDDTFSILVKVLGQIDKLQKTGDIKGLQSAKDALKDIFGGTRSAVPITALTQLYDVLQKNISLTGDIDKFNATAKNAEEIFGNLLNRFHTANTEIGKAFVNAIIGGDDFNDSLKRIVETLNHTIELAGILGETLRTGRFTVPGIGIGIATDIEKAKKQFNDLVSSFNNRINQGILGNLSIPELKLTIEQLSTKTAKSIFAPATIDQLKENLQTQLDQKEFDLKKVKVSSTDVIDQPPLQVGSTEEKTAKIILEDKLAKLKAEGASNEQILLATKYGNNQLRIYNDTNTTLGRQLEIERAINEEKKLQNNLSSNTLKLYDIAKTEGVDAAKKIGDVLAGNTSFDTFVQQGGKELDIFKKNFADVFKQQQALAFFKGNIVPGEEGLNGGFGIAIPGNESIRETPSSFDVSTAIAQRQQGLIPSVTVPINNTVNVNIDMQEQLRQFLTNYLEDFSGKIAKDLSVVGTPINKGLIDALLGKQGNTL